MDVPPQKPVVLRRIAPEVAAVIVRISNKTGVLLQLEVTRLLYTKIAIHPTM